MESILELEETIRDFINEPRKQNILLNNNIKWNTLCTSLDVIGDTTIAIDSYINKIQVNEDIGFTYIVVYGILQALFIQQDAIKYVAKALDYPLKENSLMREIREIRNDSIGHPIREQNNKVKKFNIISRHSLTLESFTLISFLPINSEPIIRNYNIKELINTQNSEVTTVLKEFLIMLEKERNNHKEEYKGRKLVLHFNENLDYYFEKLYETQDRNNSKYALIHLDLINEMIINFKKDIEERDLLDNLIGVDECLYRLVHPIKVLYKYYNMENQSIKREDAFIYIYFIREHVYKLKNMAKEIDLDYQSD